MKDKLKDIGSGFLSIVFCVAFFIGAFLLAMLFIKGGLWLSSILYPWIMFISVITLLVCIFLLLPLAVFKKTRIISGIGLFLSSYIFGLSVWVWSFLLAYFFWGVTGLLIGLFLGGVGVIPIAMLAVIFHGEWAILGQLVLAVLLTFGFRILGLYFAEQKEQKEFVVEGD